MVASDLAASNAAGGQHPLQTAEGNMRSRCIFILVPKYIQYMTNIRRVISGKQPHNFQGTWFQGLTYILVLVSVSI